MFFSRLSIMFFGIFTLNLLTNFVFIWYKICLLILPISFLDEFMSLVVRWFIKFSLWSFKVTKEFLVSFISILSNISACFENLIPSVLIFGPIFLWLFYRLLWWHFSKGFDSHLYLICTYWMSCLQQLVSPLMLALFSYNHTVLLKTFFYFTKLF